DLSAGRQTEGERVGAIVMRIFIVDECNGGLAAPAETTGVPFITFVGGMADNRVGENEVMLNGLGRVIRNSRRQAIPGSVPYA
ncbi:MAG: hypothetical protein ACTHJI_14155, partial [Leifsonia sp.]